MIPALQRIEVPGVLVDFWSDAALCDSRIWPLPGSELPQEHFLPLEFGGAVVGYEIRFCLRAPAVPILQDGKRLTAVVQDSDNGTTWTDLACGPDDIVDGAAQANLVAIVLTGADGVGSGSVSLVVRAPAACRRLIRLCTRTESGAGTEQLTDGRLFGAGLSIHFRPIPH